MATIKIHPFAAITPHGAQTIDQLLQQIHSDSLQRRERTVFGRRIKLETTIPPTTQKPFWLLDFLKIRTENAPGLVTANTQSQSIPLQQGQHFSENTAALYIPNKNIILIQYNHHGPRSSTISDYLSLYSGQQGLDYEFRIKINQNAQARLAGKTQFTKLTFKIAPANLSPAFRAQNRSLISAINHQHALANGDWIDLTMSVDARSSNSLSIAPIMQSLIALAGLGSNTVSNLQIAGRNNLTEKVDVVDLLKEKEEIAFNNMPLDHGNRILFADRANRLEIAYNGWVQAGII